jgi:hypothetical protein
MSSSIYTLHEIWSTRGTLNTSYISLVAQYLNPYGHIETVTFFGYEPDVYLVDLMRCASELETFLNQNDERLSRSSIYRTLKPLHFHRSVSHALGALHEKPETRSKYRA